MPGSRLIVQLARLGDVLQSARLVESLRCEGDVHMAVDASLAGIARLAYPGVTVHGVDLSPTGFASNACLFAALAGIGFEAVYNLNHSGLNRAMARLFPPEVVRGYRCVDGQFERDLWMRLALRWTMNRPSSPLNLVDFWGLLARNPVPPEAVNPPATARKGPLGVALAGRHARRSLPPRLLAPAVQVLWERMNGPDIWLLGDKSERLAGRELLSLLPAAVGQRTLNLAGRTNLADVYERVSTLGCLLTPDTGLMHMAARLGVPVQGVFLSSALAMETGPYGLGHTVWQAACPCSPCLETAPCTADMACLNPFAVGWPRALSGGALPQHLLRLESRFDALGLHWTGLAPDPERTMLRALLARWQRVEIVPEPDAKTLHEAAARFYTETDWVLAKQPLELSSEGAV